MGQSFSGVGNEITGISRHVEGTFATGLDDAEGRGITPAPFVSAGSEADTTGDDRMAQGAFGIVVGRRQAAVIDEGDHRIPVVEDLTRESANFVLGLVSIALS